MDTGCPKFPLTNGTSPSRFPRGTRKRKLENGAAEWRRHALFIQPQKQTGCVPGREEASLRLRGADKGRQTLQPWHHTRYMGWVTPGDGSSSAKAGWCMQHVNHTFSKAGLEGNMEEERAASHLQNSFKYLPSYAKARIHGFASPRRIHRLATGLCPLVTAINTAPTGSGRISRPTSAPARSPPSMRCRAPFRPCPPPSCAD